MACSEVAVSCSEEAIDLAGLSVPCSEEALNLACLAVPCSEEALYLASVEVEVDVVDAGPRRQSRHGAHLEVNTEVTASQNDIHIYQHDLHNKKKHVYHCNVTSISALVTA